MGKQSVRVLEIFPGMSINLTRMKNQIKSLFLWSSHRVDFRRSYEGGVLFWMPKIFWREIRFFLKKTT